MEKEQKNEMKIKRSDQSKMLSYLLDKETIHLCVFVFWFF